MLYRAPLEDNYEKTVINILWSCFIWFSQTFDRTAERTIPKTSNLSMFLSLVVHFRNCQKSSSPRNSVSTMSLIGCAKHGSGIPIVGVFLQAKFPLQWVGSCDQFHCTARRTVDIFKTKKKLPHQCYIGHSSLAPLGRHPFPPLSESPINPLLRPPLPIPPLLLPPHK